MGTFACSPGSTPAKVPATAPASAPTAAPASAPASAPAAPAAPSGSARSTASGVFTDAQARRGQQTYAGRCLSCHVPESQTGSAFFDQWGGHPLSDLYLYINQQMPQDDPGSLDPNTTADVVAYLLKLNAMPSGPAELAPDTTAMKQISIVTRTKGPTP
jgi:mono/diheme cytochrome c family protein